MEILNQLTSGLQYDVASLSGNGVALNGNSFVINSLAPNTGNPLQFTIDVLVDNSLADASSVTVTGDLQYTSQLGAASVER